MSIRVDTTSLIPGAIVCGSRGLGVLGSVIRATTAAGAAGPGVLYADWDSAADDGVEIRLQVERWPVNGVLVVAESGAASYVGAPDYAIARVYADGVDKGTKVISLFGGAPTQASLSGVGGAGTLEACGLPTIISTGSIAMVTPVGRILKVKQDGSSETNSPAKPVSVGAKLDFAWDWNDWLQAGELISEQSITSHQLLAATFLDRSAGIVTAWVEVDGAAAIGTELLASCEITTSLGRIDKRSFRLVAEIR